MKLKTYTSSQTSLKNVLSTWSLSHKTPITNSLSMKLNFSTFLLELNYSVLANQPNVLHASVSTTSFYTLWCVKCSDPHLAKDCTKPHEVATECANCNDDHIANYGKYPSILQEIENRYPAKPNTEKSPSNTIFPNFLNKSNSSHNQ